MWNYWRGVKVYRGSWWRTLFKGVRVNIDISLSLCRGRVVTLANGKNSWFTFKYKRLPNICYWCGHKTHDDKNCELWIRSKGSISSDQQQHEPWLRAAPYQSADNNVIFVPGYYENRFPPKKGMQPEVCREQ